MFNRDIPGFRLGLSALLVSCAFHLAGCDRAPQPPSEIGSEIQMLEQKTIAASGSRDGDPTVSMHPTSVQADWQVHIASAATDYFGLVKQALVPGYQVVSQTASALTLRKKLPGDVYTLELMETTGSTIAVHFLAMAD
jgi:hypothetical protein